jgi:hypothetical protein
LKREVVPMSIEPTDVFKFVSVRPVQLATEAETNEGIIRDERVNSPGEMRKLTAFLHTIDSPGAAQQYREGLKLEGPAALSAGTRKLTERYRELGTAQPPSGKKLLGELGLGKIDEAGSREEAWNALYAAHAIGPDAGPQLEVPIGALRLLHYAEALVDEPTPSVDAALARLAAQPAIALQVDAVLRPAGKPTAAPSTETTPSTAAPSPLAETARRLTTELDGAKALLAAVSRPSAAASADIEAGPPEKVGSWTEQMVAVDTTPPLQAVLGDDLPTAQTALLDQLGISRQTPLPTAASLLQEHLDALSTQALQLAGNRDFESGLLELVHLPFPVNPPPTEVDPSTAADVDVHDQIKPLGFGDLKVVKQELLAYEAGEVSYIENVLKGETKSRVFRTLDRTETTLVSTEEEVKETEKDTQATERFELKREAAQTIKEDESVKAGLSVTASYGPIVAKATGDFAYSTAKEESEKTSSDFAKEVVDKSISKIQTKVSTSRTVNTIDELEETDTHTFDNHEGKENDVGIYRWVDKLYRAQVYNYGTRMMLEFIVPEPAAFYLATHTEQKVKVDATPPPAFVNDLEPAQPQELATPLIATDITPQNYDRYAARYGAAGVAAPPPLFTSASALLSTENLDDGKSIATTFKEFVVPTGYQLHSYRYTASILWVNYPKFTIQIGADLHQILADNSDGNSRLVTASGGPGSPSDPVDGVVPVSVAAYDVHAYTLNVEGLCIRTAAAYEAWQLQTFEKIQAAYLALQSAYEQKVTQARAATEGTIQGHNPALNQAIIAAELKKLCITMMTGQHFSQFHAVTDPPDAPTHIPEIEVEEALREGPIVQFFEQAFEWEQMTYLFYPYFWARKSKWDHIVSDVEDPDPSFEEFLTAGSCRVVVPVPLTYSKAVIYMLQSAATELSQKVWLGGEPPTLESPLYESVAEELRRQTDDLFGATPEGEPWEFKLPTTLVWLQPDSTLPVFT